MKTYTPEQLTEILGKHKLWLDHADGGERADLSGADLIGANLSGANLSGADLSGADLSDTDLSGANLRDTNLSGADLIGANLSGAYLRGANLRDTDLSGADLSGAYLRDTNLRGANLRDTNLSGADLSGADLIGANLSGANLSEVRELWGAYGNGREIKALQCGTYSVTYTATHMQIGCQIHEIAKWWDFAPSEIERMDSQATAWWGIWKPILKQIIADSPAIPGAEKKPE